MRLVTMPGKKMGDRVEFTEYQISDWIFGSDLVPVGLDHQIANHDAEVGSEGGEHMQGLAIKRPAARQRLAVDRDVAGFVLAGDECAKGRGKGVGVE